MKKITAIILILIMAFSSVNVYASKVVSDGIAELVLETHRYYNTNIAHCDMTVLRPKQNMYEMYYTDNKGKHIVVQFCRTEWGTWNLGDMKIGNRYTENVVIGGGTDWEYVFRVFNPVTQNLEFTGGNHGSERLVSLSMMDAVTGEVFSLEVGQSKYVNRLVIVENTTILLANEEHLPYANVERVYTMVGDTVNLDTKVEFVRDVKMALSYTAMASVNKDFSRYCNFDDDLYVRTTPKGETNGERQGNTEAMVCHLSGDNPLATVTVGIYNKNDMTDNFSNNDKTFIWDMSEEYNKLYFSKYNLTSLNLVTKGTVWNLGAYWKIDMADVGIDNGISESFNLPY
ncbi:MAG: hypothetical protein ACI3XA_10195 [Clostridia bacterium]